MHSPKLLIQILELRLRLTLCDPHDSAAIQDDIDKLQETICHLSKVPIAFVKMVCDSRYPGFVAEQRKAGNLIEAPSKEP